MREAVELEGEAVRGDSWHRGPLLRMKSPLTASGPLRQRGTPLLVECLNHPIILYLSRIFYTLDGRTVYGKFPV